MVPLILLLLGPAIYCSGNILVCCVFLWQWGCLNSRSRY